MSVLVLNCGSSSVKYRLLDPADGDDPPRVHTSGVIERIGQPGGVADHEAALAVVLDDVLAHRPPVAVGHRIVHGGERFRGPTVVDAGVIAAIEELAVLAPLHHPPQLAGVRAAMTHLPGVPHVAVFDTAFHATIPPAASTYAVPQPWRADLGVRRYGFHGTSHAYVSRRAAQLLGRPLAQVNTIVLHLGNGASACAVAGGRSVDTSMGLTPLQGLVMGTRSGDVDPALPGYLARTAGLDVQEVDRALSTRSGLLALAGVADMREVTARAATGDPAATLALDVYCYRVRAYVGAYLVALGRLDAIAFTAGVGENSAVVRARSLAGLGGLGIVVDDARNAAGNPRISPDDAPVAVLVVPTDEEQEIATQTLAVIR